MADMRPFRDYPGYTAIMSAMPEMFLAVCRQNPVQEKFTSANLALVSLVRLYDALLDMEKDPKRFGTETGRIRASEVFPLAATLLMVTLEDKNLGDPQRNAFQAACLASSLKEHMDAASGWMRIIDAKLLLPL